MNVLEIAVLGGYIVAAWIALAGIIAVAIGKTVKTSDKKEAGQYL